MAKGENGNTKVQIEASLNADGVVAGAQQAGAAVDGMSEKIVSASATAGKSVDNIGAGAGKSAVEMTRAERSMVQSIERATAAFSAGSKSSSDYYNTLAKQRGIDPAILKPYLDALDAVAPKQKVVSEAVAATVPVMQKYEMSAKATAAALRQVPAQMTDIVVSLQGGQAPLTVLLQQGGQLKDVFGGVVPAVRAMGSYILGLINPLTVALAAAASLGFAIFKATEETKAFNKALILTGNFAGSSTGALQASSKAVADATGATQGAASEAVAAFAATGQVGAASLEKFSATAVRVQKETGVAVADTVAQFVALGKDPVSASVKLNESLHYLTLSMYQQIKALEDEGRMSEAAALAQSAYATATNERMKALHESLGTLEKGWNSIGGAAKWAWDKMLNVGRPTDVDQQIQALQERMDTAAKLREQAKTAGLGKSSPLPGNNTADQAELDHLREVKRLRDRVADNRAQEARDAQIRMDFDKAAESSLTRQEQLTKALATAKGKFGDGKIPAKEYDSYVASIRQKFADPQAGALAKATAAFEAEKVKMSYAAQADAYANGEKVLEALRAAGLVSTEQYYASKREFLKAETDAQESALTAEIGVEKKRTATGTTKSDRAIQQLEINKNILDLEAKLSKVRADAATAGVILAQQETAAGAKVVNVYEEQRKAAQAYLEVVKQGYDRTLAGQGRGGAVNAKESARAQISDKYQTDAQNATNAFEKGKQGPVETDAYQKQLALIAEFKDKALVQWQEYYDAKIAGEAVWEVGASRALENYADTAKQVAKSTENLFTNGFKGMEDAIVEFARTGTLSFSKMADSIVADLIRIVVQKNITGPIASAMAGSGSFLSMLGFAGGGSPPVGVPSIVGEKGPEIFIPKTAGMIIPNSVLTGVASQAPAASIVNNNYFTVGDVASVSMVQKAVANSQRQIVAAFARSQNYGGAVA
jgi:lambda family phage tail tape measure protein